VEHERKTKNIADKLHKGQVFSVQKRSVGGMDANESRRYELSSNKNKQNKSVEPYTNLNFRSEQRSMWITDKNFIN